MKTLTIINTVLSSILIPILFSSVFFPNEPSCLQQVESVVCKNPHNASNITVEDNTPDRVVLDDSSQEAKVIVEDNLPDRVVLDDSFQEAIKKMRAKGYKVMASFLETQRLGFETEYYTNDIFTVFAPSDEALARAKVGFGELPLILLRHITSSKLSRLSDSFHLWRTFLPGFVVIDMIHGMFNCDVRVEDSILYFDHVRRFYVYGLSEILSPLTEEEILTRRGGLLRPCDI